MAHNRGVFYNYHDTIVVIRRARDSTDYTGRTKYSAVVEVGEEHGEKFTVGPRHLITVRLHFTNCLVFKIGGASLP